MSADSASRKIDDAFSKFEGEIKEILDQIRSLIHETDPDIHEAWKWGPAFQKRGLIFGLWGFKNHVSLVFYRGAEMSDKHKLFNYGFDNAHNRMIKFHALHELNSTKLKSYIKEAIKLDTMEKPSIKRSVETSRKKIVIPADLQQWLNKNKKALTHFNALAFTYQKEMIQLLTTAKQESTRERRMQKVKAALLDGKKTV